MQYPSFVFIGLFRDRTLIKLDASDVSHTLAWATKFDSICSYLAENCNGLRSYKAVIVVNLILSLIDYLLIINVLFIKRPEDCIQGISKLDYLIKVSRFQKYKNKVLNKRTGLMNSLSSQQSLNLSTSSRDLNTMVDEAISRDSYLDNVNET